MENTRKRALELADIVASTEAPFSTALQEAKQELQEHLKKLDPQTLREVMERIRGYS